MLKKKNDHSFLFVTKCFQFCNVNGHAQRHISHLAVSNMYLDSHVCVYVVIYQRLRALSSSSPLIHHSPQKAKPTP